MTSISSVSPTRHRVTWGVRILLALAFGAAGAAKLPAVVLGLLSAFVAWQQRRDGLAWWAQASRTGRVAG